MGLKQQMGLPNLYVMKPLPSISLYNTASTRVGVSRLREAPAELRDRDQT